MTALHASVTSSLTNVPLEARAERLLVCAPNWLGDAIMALPALHALCRRQPKATVTVLCKPPLASLWTMFRDPVNIIKLKQGWRGTLETIRRLREGEFTHAVVFPNSFRSAWLPFAAGVPARRGTPGHYRRWLLTEIAVVPGNIPNRPLHQTLEYAAMANVKAAMTEEQLLSVPEKQLLQAAGRLGSRLTGTPLMLFPGAARGTSKRWPAESFAALGRRWTETGRGVVLVAGTAAEQAVCAAVAREAGDKAVNLGGCTSLPELAALTSMSAVAVANDSGGAHLAAALGTPVVVVFGQTDPAVTGPRGRDVHIIAAPVRRVNRRIARRAPAARQLLASIPMETVYATAVSAIAGRRRTST